MSAQVSAVQTADGWSVTVLGADAVTIDLHGTSININVEPDEDEKAKPLEVALGDPKSDQ